MSSNFLGKPLSSECYSSLLFDDENTSDFWLWFYLSSVLLYQGLKLFTVYDQYKIIKDEDGIKRKCEDIQRRFDVPPELAEKLNSDSLNKSNAYQIKLHEFDMLTTIATIPFDFLIAIAWVPARLYYMWTGVFCQDANNNDLKPENLQLLAGIFTYLTYKIVRIVYFSFFAAWETFKIQKPANMSNATVP